MCLVVSLARDLSGMMMKNEARIPAEESRLPAFGPSRNQVQGNTMWLVLGGTSASSSHFFARRPRLQLKCFRKEAR